MGYKNDKLGLFFVTCAPPRLLIPSLLNWRSFFPKSVISLGTCTDLYETYKRTIGTAVEGLHIVAVNEPYSRWGLTLVWRQFGTIWERLAQFQMDHWLVMQLDMLFHKEFTLQHPDCITHLWQVYPHRMTNHLRGPQPRIWEGGLVFPSWFLGRAVAAGRKFHGELSNPRTMWMVLRHGNFTDTMDDIGIFNETGPRLDHRVQPVIAHLHECEGIHRLLRRGFTSYRQMAIDVRRHGTHDTNLLSALVMNVVSGCCPLRVAAECPWERFHGWERDEFEKVRKSARATEAWWPGHKTAWNDLVNLITPPAAPAAGPR